MLGLSLGLFYFYFHVPYFGLACDHGNSFLRLEEEEREGYWIEVRTVFNVKATIDSINSSSSTILVTMYYCCGYDWWLCMVVNISVQTV